jgi:hypothetical protein
MAESVVLHLRWGSVWFSFIAAIAMFYGSPAFMIWSMIPRGSDPPLTSDNWSATIIYSLFGLIGGSWFLWEIVKAFLLTKIEEAGIRQRHVRS